jgi:hypothetical protein
VLASKTGHGFALAYALLSAQTAAACVLPEPSLKQGDVVVNWAVDAAPITVGRHFVMTVRLCPADAKLVRVDATMPEHRHGMNYKPSFTALGEGRWRVEGMMFHMPGRWALRFDVQTASRTEILTDSITLP